MTAPTLTLPGVTDITATSARPFVTLTTTSTAPGWMDAEDTDPYGFDTMRTSDAGTGDPVTVNDSVGWAETFSA